MKDFLLESGELHLSDSMAPAIVGGIFTILGVIIGWVLTETSAVLRSRQKLCFCLNSTPDSELDDVELRTKTSASEYSIEIYNIGQGPVLLDNFALYWRGHLLIQCFLSDEDRALLPYHSKAYILTQQDAQALERHCMELGFRRCRIIANMVDGKKCRAIMDASWINMRTSFHAEDSIV